MIHQSFGKLNLLVQISFIILFMIDLYKDNHVRAFVNFFLKNFSETIDWIFTKFTGMFLRYGLETFFTVTEKSGLWSDTGAQAPLYQYH